MEYTNPSQFASVLQDFEVELETAVNKTPLLTWAGATLKKLRYVGLLPEGEVYVEVDDLDLDTDGPGGLPGDECQQSGLSLPMPWGSDKVPYFVLPPQFASRFGLKLGDVGLIVSNGAYTGAIYADVGPHSKIGEASLEVFRRLGVERVVAGKVIDASLGHRAAMILFPSSAPELKDGGEWIGLDDALGAIHEAVVTCAQRIGLLEGA